MRQSLSLARACSARATLAVASPAFIAVDSVALEDHRKELVDAAVAAVGKDPTMLATRRPDRADGREPARCKTSGSSSSGLQAAATWSS